MLILSNHVSRQLLDAASELDVVVYVGKQLSRRLLELGEQMRLDVFEPLPKLRLLDLALDANVPVDQVGQLPVGAGRLDKKL